MALENLIILPLKEQLSYFPSSTIGIDIGQSLSKVVYLKDNKLHLSICPTEKNHLSIKEFIASDDSFSNINFTGGKSYNICREYSKDFKTQLINEFEANVKGVEIFYQMQNNKVIPTSLIVTIGTGTSIVLKNDKFKHLGGTAMGGGLFMGLIKVLFNMDNFQRAMDLAKKGNRYNVDLKVSDIYSAEDDRVDKLFREFTAASLGKIDLHYNMKDLDEKDIINSIVCMIGENIGTIVNLMAINNELSDIVFCGGFLRDNEIVKKILSLMCMINRNKATFLKNSEFCAAVGALCV